MKRRQAFVANSSSSSFIIVSIGVEEIHKSGYGFDEHESEYTSIDIDTLMKKLTEAKAKGITKLNIEYGGGYDG